MRSDGTARRVTWAERRGTDDEIAIGTDVTMEHGQPGEGFAINGDGTVGDRGMVLSPDITRHAVDWRATVALGE